ncbi:hypothetical protein NitYY0826_C2048 [Nitratiruptor sp. YY08-26]|nr:hypothetical protein NitYY0813_C2046 [Nitratiruptor sp. YY08-13]BCD67089.1 hypothetical protein NitYY0826_C2048 [Nitratiruptor sp. YY08-26]
MHIKQLFEAAPHRLPSPDEVCQVEYSFFHFPNLQYIPSNM